ncbi:MAG: sigma-70 family RNA polymerase sigma factor [Planctomycetes bacterium]|nr:sigma-70 family RNA polymerase sigma factor [Planctomycetota bacterium]
MARGSDPCSSISSSAVGMLCAEGPEVWELFESAWVAIERFVRVRLIMGGLRERFLEDCGQEVIARVWRFRTSYRGTSEAEFWRWLRKICDNERRRILGREATRAAALKREGNPDDVECDLPGGDETTAAAELNEELTALEECLRKLDDLCRRVIELAYFDPVLTERSIAELLDCSPSKVHTLKAEGLRLLQACLAHKGMS